MSVRGRCKPTGANPHGRFSLRDWYGWYLWNRTAWPHCGGWSVPWWLRAIYRLKGDPVRRTPRSTYEWLAQLDREGLTVEQGLARDEGR